MNRESISSFRIETASPFPETMRMCVSFQEPSMDAKEEGERFVAKYGKVGLTKPANALGINLGNSCVLTFLVSSMLEDCRSKHNPWPGLGSSTFHCSESLRPSRPVPSTAKPRGFVTRSIGRGYRKHHISPLHCTLFNNVNRLEVCTRLGTVTRGCGIHTI